MDEFWISKVIQIADLFWVTFLQDRLSVDQVTLT
jgi:hypothetical protein